LYFELWILRKPCLQIPKRRTESFEKMGKYWFRVEKLEFCHLISSLTLFMAKNKFEEKFWAQKQNCTPRILNFDTLRLPPKRILAKNENFNILFSEFHHKTNLWAIFLVNWDNKSVSHKLKILKITVLRMLSIQGLKIHRGTNLTALLFGNSGSRNESEYLLRISKITVLMHQNKWNFQAQMIGSWIFFPNSSAANDFIHLWQFFLSSPRVDYHSVWMILNYFENNGVLQRLSAMLVDIHQQQMIFISCDWYSPTEVGFSSRT
jgi:hypothetical protein